MSKKYHHLDDPHYSLVPPEKEVGYALYKSIAFGFKNAAHGRGIFAGETDGYAYHGLGFGNPTVHEFERKMAEGEGSGDTAFDALATASGMSAIDLLTRFLCLAGDRKEMVSSPKIYGGTYYYLNELAPKMGVGARFVSDPYDLEQWRSLITSRTACLLLETPANPHADVFDIAAYAKLAREYDIPLVVDNTIATHALQRPLSLGADIVIVSASKGINGHSTGLGGIIVAKKELIAELRNTWGVGVRAVMDPDCAHRMLHGLNDLEVRMHRHSENALALAEYLQKSPKVREVHYPFLDTCKHHDIAQQQMSGGGPLLGVTLRGTLEDAERFIDALTKDGTVIQAPHICHEKTLAVHPASTTHARVPEEERISLGISDTFIRVSTGTEDAPEFREVVNVFAHALAKMSANGRHKK
ncbi:MAG: O-succinylhomoserine sulfhydrylase [Patescibacteria group bacterium]|nr:MAG: O-succinylhomoserine sulfhydrylase [Patescibacteria group bacterium]